jgi:hypothetical protein
MAQRGSHRLLRDDKECRMRATQRVLLGGAVVILLVAVLGAHGAAARSLPGAPTVQISRDSAHSCFNFPGQLICSTTTIRSTTLTFPSGDVLVSTQSSQVLTGQFTDCQSRLVTRQRSLDITTQAGVPFLDTEVFRETTRGTCSLNCTVVNAFVSVAGDVKINSSQITCHA